MTREEKHKRMMDLFVNMGGNSGTKAECQQNLREFFSLQDELFRGKNPVTVEECLKWYPEGIPISRGGKK